MTHRRVTAFTNVFVANGEVPNLTRRFSATAILGNTNGPVGRQASPCSQTCYEKGDVRPCNEADDRTYPKTPAVFQNLFGCRRATKRHIQMRPICSGVPSRGSRIVATTSTIPARLPRPNECVGNSRPITQPATTNPSHWRADSATRAAEEHLPGLEAGMPQNCPAMSEPIVEPSSMRTAALR
jgi:hypothetical protein